MNMILINKITSRKVIFYFGKESTFSECRFKRTRTKLYIGNIDNKFGKFLKEKDVSLYYTRENKNTIIVPSFYTVKNIRPLSKIEILELGIESLN